MKQIIKPINYLLIAGICILAACKNNTTSEKIKSAVDTMSAKVQNAVDTAKARYDQSKDADFVKDVSKANASELHLLALGIQKGGKDVKASAHHMQADHKKLGEEMSAYAAKNNIKVDIDSSNLRSNMDDDKAGIDWDKNWVNKMVDDHEKTVKKFEDNQNDVKDPELKALIGKTLPTLHMHLDMAKQLQAKMNK